MAEGQGGGSCFNPLHCGAVVASPSPPRRGGAIRLVSIPFIAGQWSLPLGSFPRGARHRVVSIPFIAGQWSLRGPKRRTALARRSFNPLHCGAVVASGSRSSSSGGSEGFQSPSLRGSGRFLPSPQRFGERPRLVSIPFIAGQWSLPSPRSASRSRRPCFNPLHCGAVVASAERRGGQGGPNGVSIPFIAGQWSLRQGESRGLAPHPPFQSPSLRGSGRFARRSRENRRRRARFNPLHCGAVVASRPDPPPERRWSPVSIPFIAGQWSLRDPGPPGKGQPDVSIPFIAGQWSLPDWIGRG